MNRVGKLAVLIIGALVVSLAFSCGKEDEDVILPNLATPSLSASVSEMFNIALNWTDGSEGETGFIIERSVEYSPFVEITRTAADVTSYLDHDLSAGTAYYYRVRAYIQDKGYSSYSNQAEANTAQYEKNGVMIARIKMDLSIDGEDHLYVENGKMKINHRSASLPGDPNVVVEVFTDGEWKKLHTAAHRAWILHPWSNNWSSQFDMEITGLLNGEFNRIANLSIREKPSYSNCTVTIEPQNNKIIFNDARDGRHDYKITFEYWFTQKVFSNTQPVPSDMAHAQITVSPFVRDMDKLVLNNATMQFVHLGGYLPSDNVRVEICVWSGATCVNVYDTSYDTWVLPEWTGGIYSQIFTNMKLDDMISGEFNRIANLSRLTSPTNTKAYIDEDNNVIFENNANTNPTELKVKFDYFYRVPK